MSNDASQLSRWTPVIFRVVAVVLTLYPAVRKFTEYAARVDAFEEYGLPFPELAVPFTGVVELVAIVLIGFGIAGRLGAVGLGVGMVVAIAAAGPNPFSVLVLVSSVGIAVLGTGPYSAWDPTLRDLFGRLSGRDRVAAAVEE
ncbi:DoxX family protein [Halovenus salina]|uniref:DoxX family protein n=1 Tax=Halovenus salina TaxID=1510225 RepID=A0ABD5W8V4_9EURY|nr:DoxX family protein [Halovenus salina]